VVFCGFVYGHYAARGIGSFGEVGSELHTCVRAAHWVVAYWVGQLAGEEPLWEGAGGGGIFHGLVGETRVRAFWLGYGD